MTPYFLLVEEWNYPTESGREVHDLTYEEDEREDGIAACMKLANDELPNFEASTKEDALPPERLGNGDGVIITTRMGLDRFYYAARLLKVTPLYTGEAE